MVKQAVKLQKRNPLLPIFGLIIAIGLGVVAYLLMRPVIRLVPNLGGAIAGMGSRSNWGEIAVAFTLWVLMSAFAYFVVAVLTGRDPQMAEKLPPRRQKK